MSQSSNISLEICVNQTNTFGMNTAQEFLRALHSDIDSINSSSYKASKKNNYRFFIVGHEGQIRFFVHLPKKNVAIFENRLYALYPEIEIREGSLPFDSNTVFSHYEGRSRLLSTKEIKLFPLTESHSHDPYSSLLSPLAKQEKNDSSFIEIDFTPLPDQTWREGFSRSIFTSHIIPRNIKGWFLRFQKILLIFVIPLQYLGIFIGLLFGKKLWGNNHDISHTLESSRLGDSGFSVNILIGSNKSEKAKELISSFSVYNEQKGDGFVFSYLGNKSFKEITPRYSQYTTILSVKELASLVHLPTHDIKTPGIRWIKTRKMEPPHNLPSDEPPNTPIGITSFRERKIPFGIKPIDRSRHMYIIGKTGMGKSTLIENMMYSDIVSGRGVGLIDPHGDLSDHILKSIPKSRTNDIILFDPSDTEYPIGFNMLDCPNEELRPIVASGLVSIFKRMFADSWGPRLEYILRNTLLTLLSIKDTTLISIPLILTQESYRKKLISKISDPILIQFWKEEFEKMPPQMKSEAINPILNKVGQFLSSPIIRNIVGQPKNAFSLRWIMDNSKIFIVNLSKGKIGEDASALLGSMMITKFQLEAMTRADISEEKRKDFGLYVDEFQNFATESFATILSEARKYQLSLTMANQYIAQMSTGVQNAVFGNVGTIVSFQVGPRDAPTISEIFGGEKAISSEDLMNLPKYDIYTKMLVDGMPTSTFSATTFRPLKGQTSLSPEQSKDVILKVSREKYTKSRQLVEKKIREYANQITEEEKVYRNNKSK